MVWRGNEAQREKLACEGIQGTEDGAGGRMLILRNNRSVAAPELGAFSTCPRWS